MLFGQFILIYLSINYGDRKKAAALHPCGFEYREETIAAALEEREIKAKYRRAGGRTKGPPKRTKEDDERFASRLEQILRRLAKDNAG